MTDLEQNNNPVAAAIASLAGKRSGSFAEAAFVPDNVDPSPVRVAEPKSPVPATVN